MPASEGSKNAKCFVSLDNWGSQLELVGTNSTDNKHSIVLYVCSELRLRVKTVSYQDIHAQKDLQETLHANRAIGSCMY